MRRAALKEDSIEIRTADGIADAVVVRPDGAAHPGLLHLSDIRGPREAHLQLSRAPRPLPKMTINPAVADLFAFHYEDFSLQGYDPHPHIRAKVAV